MDDKNYLPSVKNALGVTGNYQDETLKEYISEVKGFLNDAGVTDEVITAGIIARGVSDLWNYASGETKFSTYFLQRAAQLSYKKAGVTENGGV